MRSSNLSLKNHRVEKGDLNLKASSQAGGPMWQRLRYSLLRRYGYLIYSAKLGRVVRQVEATGVVYRKRRRWRTAPLIALSNPVFRAAGSCIQGLPERDWLLWEEQLAPLTMGARANVDGRTLRLPEIPGVRLKEYLTQTADLSARCTAIEVAAYELARLHNLIVHRPDGEVGYFSHGDTHTGNVIYQAEAGSAVWFDFEAIHVASLPVPCRFADDWRAFGFSAAESFHPNELSQLAQIIAKSCEADIVRRELAQIARCLLQCPAAVHLAQAHLDYEQHQRFCNALIEALGD